MLALPSPVSGMRCMVFDIARSHPPHEAYLFNTDAYAALHVPDFVGRKLSVSNGLGIFQVAETASGVFSSPARAPFGGFDVWYEEDFEAFVGQVEKVLMTCGAREWHITLPPLAYGGTRAARELVTLCRLGYVVARQEYNQSLPVNDRSFLELGNYANRKRFNRAVRMGVSARRLEVAEYQAAHEVLVENRAKKGRILSMSWPQVDQLATAFPERVIGFGAFQDGGMVGAALCVVVRSDILYVYAWGERAGAEKSSPVTPIAHAIHDYARIAGFRLVDLGTSSVNGVVNPGLVAFKRSLGAYASLKFWLCRTPLAGEQVLAVPQTPAVPVDYTAIYDPETDFDRWYTVLTARRIAPCLQVGQNVLEIGSATGLLTQALLDRYCSIVCIERSHDYAMRARSKNFPDVEIHEQAVESFVPDRMFDHILAINILHEIPDFLSVVRKLQVCLAPRGELHVTLPNPFSLHRLSARGAGMIDQLDAPSDRGQSYGTLRLQTPDSLADTMKELGLREVRREAILVKPLPNSGMAVLSEDIIEAYQELAHDMPGNGALTYQVFTHA